MAFSFWGKKKSNQKLVSNTLQMETHESKKPRAAEIQEWDGNIVHQAQTLVWKQSFTSTNDQLQ